MKIKDKKGVTLIIVSLTIVVLLIITGITITYSKSYLQIKRVNYLYSDIEALNTAITDYYLEKETLPIFENNSYLKSSTALKALFNSTGKWEDNFNVNDDGEYYVIDLSKLKNLTLNYGRDYKKWTESSSYEDYEDLYIINKVTHQIYYPKGVKLDDEYFFTKDAN